MAAIAKPGMTPDDIWANAAAAADKLKPAQAAIDAGWAFGEKPPHSSFNWYQELMSQMMVHITQNGLPVWDTNTEYQAGALALYSGTLYQALIPNTGKQPDISSEDWKTFLDPQSTTPTGTMIDFAGTAAPSGYLVCDGSAKSQTTYPALFAVIGSTWNNTGGASTPAAGYFRVPPSSVGGLGLFTRGVGQSGVGGYQSDVFKSHNHTSNNETTEHTHSINHDHAAFTSASDTHNHSVANLIRADISDSGGLFASSYHSGTTTTGNDTHSHSINVPNFTGTSGGRSSAHKHTINSTGDTTETRPRSITVLRCIKF